MFYFVKLLARKQHNLLFFQGKNKRIMVKYLNYIIRYVLYYTYILYIYIYIYIILYIYTYNVYYTYVTTTCGNISKVIYLCF